MRGNQFSQLRLTGENILPAGLRWLCCWQSRTPILWTGKLWPAVGWRPSLVWIPEPRPAGWLCWAVRTPGSDRGRAGSTAPGWPDWPVSPVVVRAGLGSGLQLRTSPGSERSAGSTGWTGSWWSSSTLQMSPRQDHADLGSLINLPRSLSRVLVNWRIPPERSDRSCAWEEVARQAVSASNNFICELSLPACVSLLLVSRLW